ncbi:phage holin, LLH family [Priestia megaterium]|uniref:phage holin, LLH family n=1 Tax=Priestia megaterium TaxID=1404 RepID=UPI002E1F5E9D|nr:phage holin, LLH family [Priestia megaterium]
MTTIDWASMGITLISIAGTVIAGFIAWFLKEQVGETRITKANELLKKYKLEFVLKQSWVEEAVRYADQVLFDKKGTEKYDAVMVFVAGKAKEHGIELTPTELKVLVEAQLHKIRTGFKEGLTGIPSSNSKIDSSVIDPKFLTQPNNLKE